MTRLRVIARLLAFAGLAALLSACRAASGAPTAPLTVFAASSLRDALPAVAAGWPGGAGVAPEYNFGGSQALVAQLRQGAAADLFAAADQQTMDTAVPAGAYTLQALDRLAADPAYGPAYRQATLANVVSQEDNVRQALAKVQLGE